MTFSRIMLLPFLLAPLLLGGGCDRVTPGELVARAEQSFLNNDYRSAVLDLKEVLKHDAGNARARWLLGEVYLTVGDGRSAEKEFRRAGELGVGADTLSLPLTKALMLQEKYDAVIAYDPGEAVSAKSTGEIAAVKVLAHLEKDELAAAKEAIVVAEANAETAPDVRYARARVSFAEEELERALAQVELLNKVAPEFLPAWSLRGDLYARERDFLEAEDSYTRALAHGFASKADLVKRAFARLALGKLDLVQVDVARLLSVWKKYQPAHYLSGLVKFQQGQLEGASESLERSLELSPRHLQSMYLMAVTELRLGRENRALQLAEQTVATRPGFVPGRKILAILLLKEGKAGRAEELLQPIVLRRADDIEAKELLARALVAQERWAEAAHWLKDMASSREASKEELVRAGSVFLAAGDEAEGAGFLEKALEIDRADPIANKALVAGLIELDRNSSALAAAERYRALRPNETESSNLLGAALLAAGEREKALAMYRETLNADPVNSEASGILASYALLDEKPDLALEYVERGLSDSPDDATLLQLRAQIALLDQDMSKAVEMLEHAHKANPALTGPRVELARLLLRQGKLEDALELVIELPPESGSPMLRVRAQAHYRLNRLVEAKEDLTALISTEPRFLDAYKSLALVYEGLGDQSGLRRTLDQILRIAPTDSETLLAKARILILDGDSVGAKSALDSLDLPSDAPDLLAARVSLARRLGDSAAEISNAKALFEQRPNSVLAVVLSRAYHRTKDYRSAQDVLIGWLADHPNDLVARVELANLYVAAGTLPTAIREFRRIVQIDPNNLFALNNLAWYLRKDMPSEALTFSLRALERAPDTDSAIVMDTLAIVYAHNGDYENALRTIAKVIDTESENTSYRMRRAEINLMAGNRESAAAEIAVLLKEPVAQAIRLKLEGMIHEADPEMAAELSR